MEERQYQPTSEEFRLICEITRLQREAAELLGEGTESLFSGRCSINDEEQAVRILCDIGNPYSQYYYDLTRDIQPPKKYNCLSLYDTPLSMPNPEVVKN